MKKDYFNKITVFLLIALVVFVGCKSGSGVKETSVHQHEHVQQYTCPMHPQIAQDKPGQCPICGMDLVPKQTTAGVIAFDSSLAYLVKPVNEQIVASTPTIRPESGTRIFSVEVQGSITYDTRSQTSIASRVSGRIERLLMKYNYQPVRKGQLIMEIYSPDLAAAQRELLFIYRTDKNDPMLQKAKQKLLLLGMQPAQIQQVLNTGRILYRVPVYSNASGYILEKGATVPSTLTTVPLTTPSAGNNNMGDMSAGSSSMEAGSSSMGASNSSQMPGVNSPVLIREGQYINAGQTLFTIYRNKSVVAEFAFDPSLAGEVKRGQKLVFHKTTDSETVYTGSIGLIQPTLRAGSKFTLARVYLSDTRLPIGQLVTANIPIVSRGWWIPKSAVWQLGNQAVVFKKENQVFVPKAVQTGIAAKGLVQIMDNIGDWEIARNAAFLVDSESFIKINSDSLYQQ